jgi:hypothetical protein
MAGKRYVTEYQDIQCYGGAEEGGWYYTVTEAVQTWKLGSNKKAKKFAEQKSEEFRSEHHWSWEEHYHYAVESKKEVGQQDTTDEPRPHYE